MEEKRSIFTHCNVDIDAMCSVWFALRFIFKTKLENVNLVFKPANWDGVGVMDGDLALDIYAGGKGIKGEFRYNKIHSCFQTLVNRNIREIDPEIRKIIRSLSSFIDKHDSEGANFLRVMKISGHERSDFLNLKGLFQVFWGYKLHNNDYEVVKKFSENLDNFIELELRKKEVSKNLEETSSDKIILTRNIDVPSGFLLAQGKKMKVYVDNNNLGVVIIDRNLRTDETVSIIEEVVKEAGEKFDYGDNWFVDPSKRLICRGSRTSPVSTPSKVDPEILLQKLQSYLEKKEMEDYLFK